MRRDLFILFIYFGFNNKQFVPAELKGVALLHCDQLYHRLVGIK
jgi:hypothetical protein